jgi:hypothetical protein
VFTRSGSDSKEAVVLARSEGHAFPGASARAPQFGADGLAEFAAQDKDRGSGFGVKAARLDERFQECRRQLAV